MDLGYAVRFAVVSYSRSIKSALTLNGGEKFSNVQFFVGSEIDSVIMQTFFISAPR